MKRPTFFGGVTIALVLAFLTSVGVTFFGPVLGFDLTARLGIASVSLLYLAFLFTCNDERTGGITVFLAWGCISAAMFFLDPSLTVYCLVHVLAIWLVRSLYFYSSLLSALTDLLLLGLADAVAFWAVTHTGSVFLSTWCFFLVQAFFIFIPVSVGKTVDQATNATYSAEKFEHARACAEAALRQLIAR